MTRKISLYDLVCELQKLPNTFTVGEASIKSKLFENPGIGQCLKNFSKSGQTRKGIGLKQAGYRNIEVKKLSGTQTQRAICWEWYMKN